MKILLASPRTGSSWYYDHIEKENLKSTNVKSFGFQEFFNPIKMPHMTIQDKIDFLTNERMKGVEYTFKHHINYLINQNENYYEGWFRDFYKCHDVVVLMRRNKWNWLLSFAVQDILSWKYAAISDAEAIYNIQEDIKEYDYKKSVEQFFEIFNQINTCSNHYQTVFYEDLLDCEINSDLVRLSSLVEYEKIIGHELTIKIWNEYEKKI